MRLPTVAVALVAVTLIVPAAGRAASPVEAPSLPGEQVTVAASTAAATAGPSAIRTLQRRLARLGYLPVSGVDGVFGGQTQAAVIAFQKWVGLVRDGIPGPKTRAALARAKRPTPRTTGPGTRIEVLLDRQLLLFIRSGWVARTIHVSTGRPGFATPPGSYAILRKRRRSWSIRYKVWLPWASYLVGGIAIHGSRNVPVKRASHGCVRVPLYDARWLFRRTPVGTRVTVLASAQRS